MIQQITRGIKINVLPYYRGSFTKYGKLQHSFSYTIRIENRSENSIKLLSRMWIIKDSLHEPIIVEGEGVVGVQPFLYPGEQYQYTSGCILNSTIGSMSGFYYFKIANEEESYPIPIPLFHLQADYTRN